MDVLRALIRPQRREIAIPTYTGEDGVDLLVKALFYMYRRVNLFVPYQEAADQRVESISLEDQENLDKMYNLSEFKLILYRNKHRILSDWARNKFRSLLILTHTPQMEHLPRFPGKNFKFTVLPPDSSNDEYMRHLSESDIYAEHNMPLDVRRQVVDTLLQKYPQRNIESWASIIAEYVELLAVEVQVARLYRVASPQHSPTLSPQRSPLRSSQNSSPKLHTKPSIGRIKGLKMAPKLEEPSRPKSPVRMQTKIEPSDAPIISPLGSPLRRPVKAPSAPPSAPSSPLRMRPFQPAQPQPPHLSQAEISIQPNNLLLQQSRLAVEARLAREALLI